MCKILHLFYFQTDAPKEMVSAVNAVINESLKIQMPDHPCSFHQKK